MRFINIGKTFTKFLVWDELIDWGWCLVAALYVAGGVLGQSQGGLSMVRVGTVVGTGYWGEGVVAKCKYIG